VTPVPDLRDAVQAGVTLFNRRRYFEAHEHWERCWGESAGDARPFLEGLVQLATGLHLRTRRGGTRGAEHLLARCLVTLDDYRPHAHGIDVERLVTDVGTYLDWLREVQRPHRLLDVRRLPRIHGV